MNKESSEDEIRITTTIGISLKLKERFARHPELIFSRIVESQVNKFLDRYERLFPKDETSENE